MFNFLGYGSSQPLNFDSDGDGVLDCYAEGIDSDGDGLVDTLAMDLDGDGTFDQFMMDYDLDGDGIVDGTMIDFDGDGTFDQFCRYIDLDNDGQADGIETLLDSDGNGIFDVVFRDLDLDKDGKVDVEEHGYDYDQDGKVDFMERFIDTTGDGHYDTLQRLYNEDGDDLFETTKTFVDTNNDGAADQVFEEHLLDTDDDGTVDTLIRQTDEDADGVFDALEVYDVDLDTGALTLLSVEAGQIGDGLTADELEHFDADNADPDDVIGEPGEAMELWECQGNTGRCALYSQKFIIEELTGREINIEDLVDLAEENGWFSEEGGTVPLNMNKLLNYFGVDNELSFNGDFDDIRECLENGGKVIVSIDADEIWYGETNDMFDPTDAANHAVEVIGIDNSDPDNPMVILNDSGHEGGCGEMIPLDTFMDAWEDSGFQLITCM